MKTIILIILQETRKSKRTRIPTSNQRGNQWSKHMDKVPPTTPIPSQVFREKAYIKKCNIYN